MNPTTIFLAGAATGAIAAWILTGIAVGVTRAAMHHAIAEPEPLGTLDDLNLPHPTDPDDQPGPTDDTTDLHLQALLHDQHRDRDRGERHKP